MTRKGTVSIIDADFDYEIRITTGRTDRLLQVKKNQDFIALVNDSESDVWYFKQTDATDSEATDSDAESKAAKQLDAIIASRLKFGLSIGSGRKTAAAAAAAEDGWIACSRFPTCVHTELIQNKAIDDPFLGLNEWDVQWVGEAEWAFKRTFKLDKDQSDQPYVDLVFTGLDTFCTISVNGKKVLETSNMFTTYRVPIKSNGKVELEAVNDQYELQLDFRSAFKEGRKLEKEHGKLALWNGDSSRLHVRKAQYNYGWDWGPVLMTCGPWRPVGIDSYTTGIDDLRCSIQVGEDLSVKADITFGLKGSKDDVEAKYFVIGPDDKDDIIVNGSVTLSDGRGTASFKGKIGDFELWYPSGYGTHPRYKLVVALKEDKDGGELLCRVEKNIGFRRVCLVQDPFDDKNEPGHSFVFKVNNIPIFCGGSNWIPADSFLSRMTREKYQNWLQLLVDGNQNMVRVWGGGVYEDDSFYDICDELGIMVWQDFMFGCGQYPSYDSFCDSVKLEAEQNVKRLRHHPSIVVFAGNNEDYQFAESSKLTLDYCDETSSYKQTNFPARHIYEHLLPAIVMEHSDIHYRRSSPYSGFGQVTTDQTNGDLHQWNVWHGSQQPWHNWDQLAGRFVSEFGMEGYPNFRTVDYWLAGNKEERFPQSRTICSHNKADGFERRLELYLMENFRHAFDLDSYVYYTQVMQAECLSAAYRLWRRNWKGPGKQYTAGALVWQINDCWPTTSWAIVDYFLRPKPAYYAIKRELAPITVGMTRKHIKTHSDELSAAKFTIDTELEVWATNSDSTLERKVKLVVKFYHLNKPKWAEAPKALEVSDKTLAPNASTELWKGNLPGTKTRRSDSEVPEPIIAFAKLLDENGKVLARYVNWPEPYKYLHFPSTKEVKLAVSVDNKGTVKLTCQRPIKGLVLDVKGDDDSGVKWGDQAIDLVPDEEYTFKCEGLKGRTITTRYLCSDSVQEEFS